MSLIKEALGCSLRYIPKFISVISFIFSFLISSGVFIWSKYPLYALYVLEVIVYFSSTP